MKIAVSGFAISLLLILSTNAHAISLTLEGAGTGVSVGTSQVLYASDGGGGAVEITSIKAAAPGGGTFTELGVPSMMPDGRVVFGAEITTKGVKGSTDRHQWNVFIGNPDAQPQRRVMPLEVKSKLPWCDPAFRGDPYPVADTDGNIAFMAALGRDRDGLFLYEHGALSCLAESGTKTNEGDEIAVLSFGSPQMADKGEVIFESWLNTAKPSKHHAQALLMATRSGVHELAVEGQLGPNRTEYQRPFGLPSALASPQGTMVAFTAKTPTGAALFLYDGTGSMVRVLQTGTETPLGPVSYLSPGRPGLMADGTTAVLAGCARAPVIFRLARGLLDLRIQRGQLTPVGSVIESLGDPVLTASGAMFVGATDADGHEQLYVLDHNDEFFEVGSPEMLYRVAFDEPPQHSHTIFTGTLTVNQRGDFGYLGGK